MALCKFRIIIIIIIIIILDNMKCGKACILDGDFNAVSAVSDELFPYALKYHLIKRRL